MKRPKESVWVCAGLCGSVAKSNFKSKISLTHSTIFCNKCAYKILGDRLAAGRRVLAPLTQVRILVPQPFKNQRLTNKFRKPFNFLLSSSKKSSSSLTYGMWNVNRILAPMARRLKPLLFMTSYHRPAPIDLSRRSSKNEDGNLPLKKSSPGHGKGNHRT